MTNHLHGLLQVGYSPLGKVMQRVAVGYSRRRHRRLRTTGHLFERRYRAKLVQADLYFITLLRYIHLNPVQPGIVEHADQYRWSSHRAYLGLEALPWLHVDFGLSLFGPTVELARDNYRTLMAQSLVASETDTVEAGHAADRRVLGSDDFLATLKPPQVKRKSALTLAQLAEHLCAARSISTEEIRSPSKRPRLSAIRAELCRQVLDGRIASLHELARFLGRSPSSVYALVERHSKRRPAS